MSVLAIGICLWIVAHLAKRVIPSARMRLGAQGKGIMAFLISISLILMVWGYSQAEVVALYSPLAGMGHLNNGLMLISVYLFGVGGTKGLLFTRMRHPMLWGAVIWSAAHLVVNGDLASLLLFGGMGIWALVNMALINRAGPWSRPAGGRGLKGDAMNLVGTLILYGLFASVHIWTGHNIFLGSYS